MELACTCHRARCLIIRTLCGRLIGRPSSDQIKYLGPMCCACCLIGGKNAISAGSTGYVSTLWRLALNPPMRASPRLGGEPQPSACLRVSRGPLREDHALRLLPCSHLIPMFPCCCYSIKTCTRRSGVSGYLHCQDTGRYSCRLDRSQYSVDCSLARATKAFSHACALLIAIDLHVVW